MKHISLRIDERDYEFIRNLAKKKKIRESNIFREVFHDFVLRSTGQTSLGELESILNKTTDELRDLETRIARIEGLISVSSPSLSSLLTQQSDTTSKSSEADSPVSASLNDTFSSSQAMGEIVQQFASENNSRVEGEFLKHCASAAESAAKIHDYPQALRYYRIVLELVEDAEIRSATSEKIGDLEYLTGENDLALKYWKDALPTFLNTGKKKTAANIHRKIGLMYLNGVYDRKKGLESFKEALKLLEEENARESPEGAAVYENIARLYWRMGENLNEAGELCEKALNLAERFSLREVEANAHQTLGFLLPITKKKEILQHFQTSLRIAIENGCYEATSRAYNNLGYVYMALGGDMKKSVQFYQEGLRFERRIHDAVLYAYTKLALTLYAYIPMGEWNKAKESVNEFLPELSMQHPHRFLSAFQILGQLAVRRGELESAREYFDAYLQIAIKAKEVQAVIPSYTALGNLYFEKREYPRAEEYLRKALDASRQMGLRFDNCMRYAGCLSLLARVCGKEGKLSEANTLVSELSSIVKSIDEDWAYGYYFRALGATQADEGNHAEAAEAYEKSIEKWRRLDWLFELACDSYELGVVYLMSGERDKAMKQIEYSLDTFTKLGAKAHIDRVSAKKESLSMISDSPASNVLQL